MLRKIIISLAFIILFGVNLFLLSFFIKQYKVVEVVDGDTFQLASGKRVRLMGVDAPEYNRCGGPEARKLLSSLILNSYVFLREEQQETFGRSLALVYSNKGLINKIILEEGWGRPDYRANSQRDVLTAAYHKAKDAQLGVYSALCRTAPTNSTNSTDTCFIKGNIDKNTYKKYYHLPGCKQYNQIVLEKDIGEQCFATEEEAIKAGFVKSAGCPEVEQQIGIPELGIAIPFPKNKYALCPGYYPSQSYTFVSSGSAEIYLNDNQTVSCSDNPSVIRDPGIYRISFDSLKSVEEFMNKAVSCNDTQEVLLFQNTVKGLIVDFSKPKEGCLPYTGGARFSLFIPFPSKDKIISISATGELPSLVSLLQSLTINQPSPSHSN